MWGIEYPSVEGRIRYSGTAVLIFGCKKGELMCPSLMYHIESIPL